MAGAKQAIDGLVKAWNETHAGARDALLAKHVTGDSKLTSVDGSTIDGRRALAARIEADLRDPAHRVERDGGIVQFGGDGVGFHLRFESSAADTRVDRFEGKLQGGKLAELTAHPSKLRPSRITPIVEQLVANPVVVGGISGLFLYIAVRWTMSSFYDEFGATPDEAGFGSVDVVRQSAPLLLLVLLAGAAYAFVAALLSRPVERYAQTLRLLKTAGRKRERRVLNAARYVPLGVLVAAELALVPVLSSDSPNTVLVVLVGGLLAVASIALFLAPVLVLHHWSPVHDVRVAAEENIRRRGRGRLLRLVLGVGFAVFAYVLVGVVPTIARDDAQKVLQGGTFSSRIVPWRAEPVHLTWEDGKRPGNLVNSCRSLRFLGEANGVLLLYDSARRATYRIRSSGTNIKLDRDCPSQPPRSLVAIDRRLPDACPVGAEHVVRKVPLRDRNGRRAGVGFVRYSEDCAAVWGEARASDRVASVRVRTSRIARPARALVDAPPHAAVGKMLSARPGCVRVSFQVVVRGRRGPVASGSACRPDPDGRR